MRCPVPHDWTLYGTWQSAWTVYSQMLRANIWTVIMVIHWNGIRTRLNCLPVNLLKDELQSDCNLLNNDVETDEHNIHLNIPFSQHKLGRALRQAKQNTSPGEDGIPYECLKKLPGAGQRILLKLYNVIRETGKLPHNWKNSIVLPIPKAGKDPHQPSSYRPIALTSTLCKIMEHLVANWLVWYLEKNSILSNLQIAFRKNQYTLD